MMQGPQVNLSLQDHRRGKASVLQIDLGEGPILVGGLKDMHQTVFVGDVDSLADEHGRGAEVSAQAFLPQQLPTGSFVATGNAIVADGKQSAVVK